MMQENTWLGRTKSESAVAKDFRVMASYLLSGRNLGEVFADIDPATLPVLPRSTKTDRWGPPEYYEKQYYQQLMVQLGRDAQYGGRVDARAISDLVARYPGEYYGISDHETHQFLSDCLASARTLKTTDRPHERAHADLRAQRAENREANNPYRRW